MDDTSSADAGAPADGSDGGASSASDGGEAESEPADAGAVATGAHDGGEGIAPSVADAGTETPEAGWISLGDECQTFDLLALQNGISSELGFESLPPGSYGQIRLMLREARIVVGGAEMPLTIASGVESGIKIVHGFELESGSLTTLALDFDADRSIHETPGHGYVMRPVIELVGERTQSLEHVRARESAAEMTRSSGEHRPSARDPGAAQDETNITDTSEVTDPPGDAKRDAAGGQRSDRDLSARE